MFICKLLIACALIAAAQASYGYRNVLGGYAAQMQPAATLTVMPYGHGGYSGYAPGYGHGYGMSYNRNTHNLAHLALSLPSAGSPIPTSISYPHHPSAGYSGPINVPLYDNYGHSSYDSPATASTAAAAASKVAQNGLRAAYAPVSMKKHY